MTVNAKPWSAAYIMLVLVACQCGLHGCMAGMRMALPLQALEQGYSKFSIGLIASSFAILPAVMALRFGRYTDRHGYHGPTFLAVCLSLLSAITAFLSHSLPSLMLAAGLCGAGSGFGMIAIQRRASRLVTTSAERLKVFSWVALAPAVGGLIGPLMAGGLVDGYGFKAAFLALLVLPLLSLLAVILVPNEPASLSSAGDQRLKSTRTWDLIKIMPLRRILLINLLVVTSWDVHSFALPILGHEREFSATMIGAIFGAYASASLLVRGLLPFIIGFFPQRWMPFLAMSTLAVVFAVYPLLPAAWLMMLCACLFGIVIGVVQPTIMSILHDAAPSERQGETLALRSMLNQLAMTILPLVYGVLGVLLGAGAMFWVMSVALCFGAWRALYFIHSGESRGTRAA